MTLKRPRFLCSDFFLDLIYPTRCPACMRVIGWDMQLCGECESGLEYIEGVPWQAIFPEEINGEAPSFDRAEALFYYSGTARDAVLSLKNRRGVRFADYAAKRIVEKLAVDDGDDADIITSVPMHRSKKRKRGYDQAEVFARALSRETGIEYVPDLLAHRKNKVAQHDLGMKERFSSAETTYHINSGTSLKGRRVILCDDIFTTGATANVCSRLLKDMGAEKVTVAAICRTDNKSDKNKSGGDTSAERREG